LSGPGYLTNGQFRLSVNGVPGCKYAIWASTILDNRTPLQANIPPFIFTDTNGSAFPSRFYLAQYVP
jgi:hypothetical protein